MTSIIKLIAQYAYFIVLCLEVLLAISLVVYKVAKHFKGKKVEVSESKELAEELKLSKLLTTKKQLTYLLLLLFQPVLNLRNIAELLAENLKR